MDILLLDELERRVERLLELNHSLMQENELLRDDNSRLQHININVKDRIDTLLTKLQRVEKS